MSDENKNSKPMLSVLDPTLDVVFKLLFGSPDSTTVLTALLTDVLKPKTPISKIIVKNPEMPKEWVTDKGIMLDLMIDLENGEQIDVEMQSDFHPGLRRRALYYWARMYSAQLARGDHYKSLKPSVVVFFMDFDALQGNRFHSIFRALEIHNHEELSRVFEIHTIELPKLVKMSPPERKEEGRLTLWGRFLSAKTDEELDQVAKEDPMVKEAKDLLVNLSAKPSVQELARQREMGRRMYRFHLHAAREEGLQEGLTKGTSDGIFEGQKKVALNMLKAGIPAEQVQALTELSKEAIDELIAQITH